MAPQDAKLYLDQDMREPEALRFARGQAAVFTARCPIKETPNEDSAALIPFGKCSGVLVVADGLGGSPAGEQAANLAIHALVSAIHQAAADDDMLRTAILNGFEIANRNVQELAGGAATTLAAVELDGPVMRPYHVGDSTILVLGQRGKIKLQTMPHSPVGYAVEAGMLDPADAMEHEDRHLVSNVIGSPQMRIEVGPRLELAPRDTLLLASDGLLDNLHSDEIVRILRKGTLEQASRDLLDAATQRISDPAIGQPSKPDDLTFITYRRLKND